MNYIKYFLPLFFLLCGVNSAAVTTPIVLKGTGDASQWKLQDSISDAGLNSVVSNQMDLIAIGQQNAQQLILKSGDGGTTWSTLSPTGKLTDNLNAIYANNQDLIAVGNKQAILVSHDGGAHWQLAPVPSEIKTEHSKLNAIAAKGTDVIAVGQYNPFSWIDTPAAVMLVSHDGGNSWTFNKATLLPDLQKVSSTFNAILWDGEQWIAAGSVRYGNNFSNNGFIVTSPDGVNWTYATITPAQLNIKTLATNGREYFAIANDGGGSTRHTRLLKSVDHARTWNWLPQSLPAYVTDIESLVWNGQLWVGVGTRSIGEESDSNSDVLPLIIVSKDGEHWSQTILPVGVRLQPDRNVNVTSAAWNGQNWVAVGVYNKQGPGCESFSGQWAGTLTAQGLAVNVKPLSLSFISGGKEGHYTVGGGAITYHFNTSEIGEGLGGTCTEQNDLATLNVFNNNPRSSARLVATKLFDSDVINIISSNLSDGKGYRNFVGTLRRNG